MTIQDFIDQHPDQKNVGDTSGNIGQCVGLVEVWFDTMNLSHVWGNACDMPANADPNVFDVVNNSPTYLPPIGSAVVWPKGFGGSDVGHVALIAPGTTLDQMAVFEANDTIGGGDGGTRLHNFSYEYGLTSEQINEGWPKFIVPKILEQTNPVPAPAEDTTVETPDQTLNKFWHGPRPINLPDGEAVDGSVDGLISYIENLKPQVADLQGQFTRAKVDASECHAVCDSQTAKINGLTQALADKSKALYEANTNLNAAQTALASSKTPKPAVATAGRIVGRNATLGALGLSVATIVSAALHYFGINIPAQTLGADALTAYGALVGLDVWVRNNLKIKANGIIGF